MLYDITPRISADLRVWPGDTPPTREVLLDMKTGANITLSTLRATVHLGAHADAPSHYGRDAAAIESRELNYYLGPCQVVHVSAPRGQRIGVEHLLPSGKLPPDDAPPRLADALSRITQPRVLFRTGTFPNPCLWNNDFAALQPELVDELHACGVLLIGLDTPSVDLMDSKDLPAHQRFLAHDMAILEGLVLTHVPEGVYELIALPLPLSGFDASPVRAVLRTIERASGCGADGPPR